MNRSRSSRLTRPALVALGILSRADDGLPGIEISNKARLLPGNATRLPVATLYPTLASLEDMGLVTAKDEPQDREVGRYGAPRRLWYITEAGKRAITEALIVTLREAGHTKQEAKHAVTFFERARKHPARAR